MVLKRRCDYPGCTLPDLHAGLHNLTVSLPKRGYAEQPRPSEVNEGCRVRALWKHIDLKDESNEFEGTVVARREILGPDQKPSLAYQVQYDDGDLYWHELHMWTPLLKVLSRGSSEGEQTPKRRRRARAPASPSGGKAAASPNAIGSPLRPKHERLVCEPCAVEGGVEGETSAANQGEEDSRDGGASDVEAAVEDETAAGMLAVVEEAAHVEAVQLALEAAIDEADQTRAPAVASSWSPVPADGESSHGTLPVSFTSSPEASTSDGVPDGSLALAAPWCSAWQSVPSPLPSCERVVERMLKLNAIQHLISPQAYDKKLEEIMAEI